MEPTLARLEGMDTSKNSGTVTINPLLVLDDAAGALDFYQRVFGAEQLVRIDTPEGGVLHAELGLGDSIVTVMEASDDFGTASQSSVMDAAGKDPDTTCFSLDITVADVDAITEAAREAGATVREEPKDFEAAGVRFASIRDPFGVRWSIRQVIEQISKNEEQRRLQELFGGAG